MARATSSSHPDYPAAFVDSSAIIALVDRDDASHPAAVEAYHSLVRAGYRLFTTDHVVAETFDLLSASLGVASARQLLRDSRLAVYDVTPDDMERARASLLSRTGSQPLSMTNALSLAVMERLGVPDAFAVDPSFLAEMN
ncbi:MAG: type II toxin-antitoxin system VapC family toxin [Thermomicrobiales bacterium]